MIRQHFRRATRILVATSLAFGPLAPPVGDHMVPQREPAAPIWGRSDPGAVIAIQPSWVTEPVTTRADTDGRWRATLQTPAAGGPHTISIRDRHGKTIELDDVLLVGGESDLKVGTPVVDGAKVVGTITAQGRGPKITVFKMKRRKGYRRKQGHRQDYTESLVDRIEA